jgi:uncharacterized membrane protein (DUF2068 family)
MRPAESGARWLRRVAAFEALKGSATLVAAAGLLWRVHPDLHQAAAAIIGHIGLRPGDHDPAVALGMLDQWLAADRRLLLLAAAGYVLLRFTEACGLWRARPWGEHLGAVSGALYVPFELQHLIQRPGVLGAGVLAANLLVVGFLAWRLQRRAALAPTAAQAPCGGAAK